MSGFKLQPQRQAIGSFAGPNGQDVPVYVTQPWYRAFQALIGAGSSSITPITPVDSLTIDELPAYDYGDMLFRSSVTSLAALASGPAGQIIYSGGPGHAPLWADPPTTAPLSPIPTSTLLANTTGAVAAPISTTVSALLDAALGNTQGQLITRNAGGWTVLNPSTGGKVLTENGAASNLTWNTPSGGGGGTAFPLDSYKAGLWAVYGLQRYLTTYTGPLIQVRNSSTSAVLDIGYVTATGLLDTAALATFLGANSGSVSIWYDQSGLANNLVQATAAQQPAIYTSGTYLGYIAGDGVDDNMVTPNNSSATNRAFHVFTKYTFPTGGGVTQVMLEHNSTVGGTDGALLYNSSNQLNLNMSQSSPTTQNVNVTPNFPLSPTVSSPTVVNADWLWNRDGANSSTYSTMSGRDGTLVGATSTALGTLVGNFIAGPWRVWNRTGNNFPSIWQLQAMVIYEANMQSRRSVIAPCL